MLAFLKPHKFGNINSKLLHQSIINKLSAQMSDKLISPFVDKLILETNPIIKINSSIDKIKLERIPLDKFYSFPVKTIYLNLRFMP